MRPVLDDLGRPALYLLGLLGALKAAGLVLLAQGAAAGLAALLAHGDGWRAAVWFGIAGAVLRGAAGWALQVASARVALGVKERLRGRVLRRAVTDARGAVGATTTLATAGLDELDRYYTVFLPTLVGAATVPLLVGVRILFADWVSALVIVLTIPLIPVFMALIGMHTRESVANATTALARLSDHMVELARGLPVLVGIGRVREQTNALRDLSEDWRRTSSGALRTAFLSALALELISTISVALVAVFVGVRLVAGTMPLEAGLVALVLAPECYAPFRDIGSAFHASQTGLEARTRVQRLLDEPAPAAALVRTATATGVAVSGLTVTHAGRTAPTVTRLSFRAEAGSVLSLDGPSGAGKSTVLAVLAGRGAELEAGAALTGAIAAPAERAWLPQHPQFAGDSASAELRAYGADGVTAAALLRRVGVPDADPARLSPGEQRRLGLARVLARVEAGAALVLLDEPTAHLDDASATVVRAEIAALAARGVTVVLASHDPAVHALADLHVPVTGSARPTGNGVASAPSPEARPAVSAVSALPVAPTGPHAARGEDPEREDAAARTARPGLVALRELAVALAPARGKTLGAIGLGTAAALFAVALAALSGWLIVRAAQHPPILFLEVAIVGVRFFGIGRAALRYSERLMTHDAVFTALTDLRMRLWRGLAAQGPAGRVRLTAANTLDRLIGDGDRMRDLAPRVVVPFVSGVLAALASVIALWILWAPAGAILLAACVLALGGGGLLAVLADARATADRDRDRSAILRRTAALLTARDDLAANGVADGELDVVSSLGARAASSALRTAAALGSAGAVVVAVCTTAAMTMMLAAQPLTTHGPLPVPLVAVFVFTPLALVDPLLEAVGAAQRWPELARVLARIAPVTDAGEAASRAALDPGAPVGRVSEIRLDEVAYRYPGASRDVFEHCDAVVGPGEWLVLTGPSGSGKTTMVGLLLRYLRPTAGRYLVDGTDAGGLDADALRRRVGWCPQEGHLFDSTLRGNLAIARDRSHRPTDAELEAVLTAVGLGPLLDTLPLGLDTPIGPAGSYLSGGQRQRVAVARTLLAESDVVLLDEPTAHLDEDAAARLLADLRDALAGKATVHVTHRDREIRAADRRLDLARPARAGRALV